MPALPKIARKAAQGIGRVAESTASKALAPIPASGSHAIGQMAKGYAKDVMKHPIREGAMLAGGAVLGKAAQAARLLPSALRGAKIEKYVSENAKILSEQKGILGKTREIRDSASGAAKGGRIAAKMIKQSEVAGYPSPGKYFNKAIKTGRKEAGALASRAQKQLDEGAKVYYKNRAIQSEATKQFVENNRALASKVHKTRNYAKAGALAGGAQSRIK